MSNVKIGAVGQTFLNIHKCLAVTCRFRFCSFRYVLRKMIPSFQWYEPVISCACLNTEFILMLDTPTRFYR